MSKRHDAPTQLDVEQWLLSEEGDAARARIEAHLSLEERATRRDDDAALRRRLFAAVPPDAMVARVRARHARSAAPSPKGRMMAQAFAALAVVGVVALVGLRSNLRVRDPQAVDASERVKGGMFDLRVYRRRGSTFERVQEGDEATAGEVVQLGFGRGAFTHGVLLSVDGRGAVTLHAPRDAAESSALGSAAQRVLPESYELDDAPGFERFFFVASTQPLSVVDVLASARALAEEPARAASASLPLAQPHEERSLLLRKRSTR